VTCPLGCGDFDITAEGLRIRTLSQDLAVVRGPRPQMPINGEAEA